MPTIVREIGFCFGLKSCIYFECTMNKTNCDDENERNECFRACPICIAKLRINIKFDTLERFNRLSSVCAELGLVTESIEYDQLLTDWLT